MGCDGLDLDEVDVASTADDETLLRINEALDFAGLSIEEAAVALAISPATAKRHWAFARAWLFAELKRSA